MLPLSPFQITGTLREYQMMGLSWLVRCFDHGVNAILADEMVGMHPSLARSCLTVLHLLPAPPRR